MISTSLTLPAALSAPLRRCWTEPKLFDHAGGFCKTRGTYSDVRCRQQPHIPIYGGGSDAAIRGYDAVQ